jgi:biotin transport system substrate-specific component
VAASITHVRIEAENQEAALQRTGTLTLADAVFPRITSDSRAAVLARDFALMTGFALFTALCAQIAIQTPWTTVPITMQTFAVLVAGGSLGMWRGAGSMVIYAVLGSLLFSVFAPADPGVSGNWDLHFILPWSGTKDFVWDIPSGGYIVGFILAAALVGFLCQHEWDRKPWVHFGMFLGAAVLYIPGILWLAYDLDVSLSKALEYGLYPFIVGDMMKLGLASLTLPLAWTLVQRTKRGTGDDSSDSAPPA